MQSGEEPSRSAGEAPPPAAAPAPVKKKKVKKRREKVSNQDEAAGGGSGTAAPGTASASAVPPSKKQRKRKANSGNSHTTTARQGSHHPGGHHESVGTTAAADPAQQAVYDQMRRALEEDQYSAIGSIVEGSDGEEEEDFFLYRGQAVRLDRAAMAQTARKLSHAYWSHMHQQKGSGPESGDGEEDMDDDDFDDDDEDDNGGGGRNRKKDAASRHNKKKRKKEVAALALTGHPGAPSSGPVDVAGGGSGVATTLGAHPRDSVAGAGAANSSFLDVEDDMDRDGGSIFGQTQGATNSTWVECDKCKKWRRLRGVVDEKKLPTKWYCSMNRNDPERARCSAPEEDYDTQQTPESAADARTRKHLRVWVRRLQCQEAYEARQPTLTRGKKRAAATSTSSSSMKDHHAAYEWVRCCNPSCGKWRAVLRFMDVKSAVVDRLENAEWYCVQNTWDESCSSCAAPQENLPAYGCPPWVLQDED